MRHQGMNICGEPDPKSGGLILCSHAPGHPDGHSWETAEPVRKPESLPQSEGHRLAREIIAKHGRDRYPDSHLNAMKAAAECGELLGAILREHDYPPGSAMPAVQLFDAIRKEYADAGLALYALGDKLGLDLITEMARVVNGESRKFTGLDEAGPAYPGPGVEQ